MPRSCRNAPIEQQIAVDLRIARGDAEHDLHEVDDVFQEAAQVGVVVLHAGRGAGELGHERLVHEKALGQGLQARLGEAAEDFAQPDHELVHFYRPQAGRNRPDRLPSGVARVSRVAINCTAPWNNCVVPSTRT